MAPSSNDNPYTPPNAGTTRRWNVTRRRVWWIQRLLVIQWLLAVNFFVAFPMFLAAVCWDFRPYGRNETLRRVFIDYTAHSLGLGFLGSLLGAFFVARFALRLPRAFPIRVKVLYFGAGLLPLVLVMAAMTWLYFSIRVSLVSD